LALCILRCLFISKDFSQWRVRRWYLPTCKREFTNVLSKTQSPELLEEEVVSTVVKPRGKGVSTFT
jgi:hypothetical protein